MKSVRTQDQPESHQHRRQVASGLTCRLTLVSALPADADAPPRPAATPTRGEVSMRTAKAGDRRGPAAPALVRSAFRNRSGGGVAFGPKPRHYTVKVNRKARRKAMRAALSIHAERDSVAVLDATAFETPSTKQAAEALEKWGGSAPP